MALALLGRRQGRLLARALTVTESYIANGAFDRVTPFDETDLNPDVCSTSQQHSFSDGGWPRGIQTRKYAVNNKPSIRYVPVSEPEHDDFSGEPKTYTQLLASIRSAKNLKRLQHLLSTYSNLFDAVHVAAAVARLPSLVKFREKDLVDRSDTLVVKTPGVARRRTKHGAKSKQGHVLEGSRIATQLDALMVQHAPNFLPRQACCSIWAFGELRHLGVVERLDSLQDLLLAITKGDMEPLRVHGHGVDFAQLLQGLSKLGHNDANLLDQLAPLLQERLSSMQQRELHMSAYGLAKLGYTNALLFNTIADQLVRTGTAFILPSGAAGVFWAFAKAGVQRPDLFSSLAATIMGQALLLAPQDVATTLWACRRLGVQNPQLFTVLGDAMLRDLATCSDAEVSSAMESLGLLGYHHVPLMDAVATSILAEPVIGADPVCIARVLAAYAHLGRRGQQDLELVNKLGRALAPRMSIVRVETLATACWALDRYGFRDQEALSAFASRAEFLLRDCSVRYLAHILRFLGNSGHAHYQLAVASARQLPTAVVTSDKEFQAVVEILYLCARQGVEDPEAADAVLALAATYRQEVRTVGAARLMVAGQLMNKQGPVLSEMADVVLQDAASLDAATAMVALQSARALGRNDIVAALAAAPQGVVIDGRQQGAVATAGV